MKRVCSIVAGFILLVSGADEVEGQNFKDSKDMSRDGEHHSLYTEPDLSCSGGIKGRIASPAMPIKTILALPPDEPEKVYSGTVSGEDRRDFVFTGLPMGRYDLFVIYDNSFYEGLQINRGENTLTKQDIEKIQFIINKSEPFWSNKYIHRIEGTTGRGNFARAVLSMYKQTREGEGWFDAHKQEKITGISVKEQNLMLGRLTYKVFTLKDVGVGWQVTAARDLFPNWVDRKYNNPAYHFSEALQRIRVSDQVRDLGEIKL